MLKLFSVAVVLTSLMGCSAMNAEQYHKATLKAIETSENKIGDRITNLEGKLNNQTDYIDSLEYEISMLKQQVDKLNSLTYMGNSSQTIKITNKTQSAAAPIPEHEVVLGSVEKVTIDAVNKTLDARVDTGAKTSSINAEDIESFERNGEEWVRFHIANDKDEKKEWIEAPVVRNVKIKQASNEDGEKRIVVKLWVTVGDIHEKTEFTLADRSQMSHPILLGREFIRDIALVDVSKEYIHTNKNAKTQTKKNNTK
ncbi:ATP-dependent zinc protease [Vibrio sp.]|uniref:ATP-dependent zinc protease n=1 Tax=Vibrio viridaestus TaxID=2487322 RepID=A0A3N9TE13_9VIBR|nr:ATP-dependent zinc protease [Vibrio viridaestus]MDC0609465.1 ATP-dependent zinc protease [Vibrio sp.]RQW61943.1 ATP-dependent zinc protease [Vibrio viridaestus]